MQAITIASVSCFRHSRDDIEASSFIYQMFFSIVCHLRIVHYTIFGILPSNGALQKFPVISQKNPRGVLRWVICSIRFDLI